VRSVGGWRDHATELWDALRMICEVVDRYDQVIPA
jgi:hypothetical protein